MGDIFLYLIIIVLIIVVPYFIYQKIAMNKKEIELKNIMIEESLKRQKYMEENPDKFESESEKE